MKLNHKHLYSKANHHSRGAAAVLAMMFLVIFGSLAAAMAIVSQGNLSTANSYLKINRALAAAETGVEFMIYKLNQATNVVLTRDGIIDPSNAPDLWDNVCDALEDSMTSGFYQGVTWGYGPGVVSFSGIPTAPGAPRFNAVFQQHPILGEDYGSSYYSRPPFNEMTPAVTASMPLDPTWVRLTVTAYDGPEDDRVTRSIKLDLKIKKTIPYAILSRSRVMVGRNVMIDGPIGSRFMETNLEHGHPIQMASDFRGLTPELDKKLDSLIGSLVGDDNHHDTNGDNRIDINNPVELGNINPEEFDVNSDGYIDDFDLFLKEFGNYDSNTNQIQVDASDLQYQGVTPIEASQLIELIDTFGSPSRPGYSDGVINALDCYTKIRGEVYIAASREDWNNGAADPHHNGSTSYQDYFQGSITPDYQQNPLTFNASLDSTYQFEADDFDVSTFRNKATGDLQSQMIQQINTNPLEEPAKPIYNSEGLKESIPYGAAHPYDYYERPVYKNMTFTNITIPKGTNALFENCTFIGVTFVETETNNTDPNYNYAGMQENNSDFKHPDKTININGKKESNELGSKLHANNIRFDGCSFEGAVVTDAPKEYTHTRNKLAFTGDTQFNIKESIHLSDDEKQLYERSAILAPQYSVELGTFVSPSDSNETVNLTGTIVAGLIDLRGQIKVNGSIITTFHPKSNTGPILGNTSPQFNTTLGYFSSAEGDLEAEIPSNGVGVIQIKYDSTVPLPDGILGPIQIQPVYATYTETSSK